MAPRAGSALRDTHGDAADPTPPVPPGTRPRRGPVRGRTGATIPASGDPPMRNTMPVESFGPALSVLYSRGLTLDDARRIGAELPGPAPVAELASSDDETMTVEAGEQTSLENDGPDAVEVP